MARFKTVLEQAVALSWAGRLLRLPELRLVQSVLGNGCGRDSGQSLASGQGLGQAASRPIRARFDLEQASAAVVREQTTLREHALKHGQRRGEWWDWGFGGKLAKKGANARRKAGAK